MFKFTRFNDCSQSSQADEWIWIEGYKGTDKDMVCKGHQYKMNYQHDMLGDNITLCTSGFHLCVELKDVFPYYNIGDNNRFFKVRALVRKSDYENASKSQTYDYHYYTFLNRSDSKITSKSIVFVEELTIDEILKPIVDDLYDWTEEDKRTAIESSVYAAKRIVAERKEIAEKNKRVNELVRLGYSEAFARIIVEQGKYDIAYAVGTQEGLSMDMKVFAIMK